MASLVLTVIGDDRPGLVSALSAPIKVHGGSWERSQLSHLAGKFAGIVLVSIPTKSLDALVADLLALGEHGLHVVVERTDQPTERESVRFSLELLGADHPGIVAEISAALAANGVSIEELTTDIWSRRRWPGADLRGAGGPRRAAGGERRRPARGPRGARRPADGGRAPLARVSDRSGRTSR